MRSIKEKETLVKALKRIELSVLFHTLCDLSTDEVAGELNMASSTVNYHLTKIYNYFQIEGEGRAKRENLIREFQGVVFTMIQSTEAINKWIRTIPPTPMPPVSRRTLDGKDLMAPKSTFQNVIKRFYENNRDLTEKALDEIAGVSTS